MKNLFTMLFVAGFATGAFASGEDSVKIKKTDASKVEVEYSAVPKGAVIVKIYDLEDHLIMRDRIASSEAFSKKYDLHELPEGTYSIEVLDQSGILTSASVKNFKEVKPLVYSRVAKVDENKYRLLVSNLEAKDITVSIYDGDQLIHSELVTDEQGLHKIYSIKRPSSVITFKVSTANGFDKFLSVL